METKPFAHAFRLALGTWSADRDEDGFEFPTITAGGVTYRVETWHPLEKLTPPSREDGVVSPPAHGG